MHTRFRLALLPALLLVASSGADVRHQDIADWSSEVWALSLAGEYEALEAMLEHVPGDQLVPESAHRYTDSYARFQAHHAEATRQRSQDRLDAHKAMQEAMDDADLREALKQAVVVQSLSDDLDLVFEDPIVKEVIQAAKEKVVVLMEEEFWIDLQEVLFMLMALHEDTKHDELYHRYRGKLESVNHRVGLLSLYSPRTYHDLRSDWAVRNGEEPFDPFNDALATDYHERLESIDHHMLYAALRVAAARHIESQGWVPLLLGGLDAIENLVTTSALADEFPLLGNEDSVERFLEAVSAERGLLQDMKRSRVSVVTARNLLDALISANEQTVDLDWRIVVREFGNGAMESLDTYSDIVWPDALRRFSQNTAGNFVGIGVQIRLNDTREILVVTPLEGTPAWSAGVRPDDLIKQVDGEDTSTWSLNDAVDRITGKQGTTVVLGLRRDGEDELLSVEIVRDVIKLWSVKGWEKVDSTPDGTPKWNWYIDSFNGIGYMRLSQFTEATVGDMLEGWRQMHEVDADGPSGLILDLRHNPGGLLSSAVRVSNLFLETGEIVSVEDRDGNQLGAGFRARGNLADMAGVPLVILVNKGSASASEIVSGALQAYGRGVVVGERSFGKGSVQTVNVISPMARLKLTEQYYRLPPRGEDAVGRLVHKRPGATTWGVDPDLEVVMYPQQVRDGLDLRQRAEMVVLPGSEEVEADVNDLISEGIDPQLELALLLLQARVLGTDTERHLVHSEPPASNGG